MRSRKHAQTRPSPVPVALLLIDVLTTFQFPDGDAILKNALAMRDPLVRLKSRAREAGIPVLYVNDNLGDWRSEKEVLMGRCLEGKGAKFVRSLMPDSEDYFVLKPKHSGFFGTTLDTLLETLRIRRVILTGIAGNICVLFTANDAYMRELKIITPPDCIVSNTPEENAHALEQIGSILKGHLTPSTLLNFRK